MKKMISLKTANSTIKTAKQSAWGKTCTNKKIKLKKINHLLNKSLYILFLVILYFLIGCDIDDINYSNKTNKTTKIYSGSYGYNVAYRIVDNKVYSGSYGYEVGYDVAYKIDGDKIYSGSFGYDVAYMVGF